MKGLKLKFVSWFNSLHPGKYCWADCVSWAFSKRLNPFKIDSSKGCQEESKHGNACYCGQWYNGQCFGLLSKDQQEKIRKEFNEPF